MQNMKNEVCVLLRRIFTLVTNLFETTIVISQKFRKTNDIKLNHAFFLGTCLRVFVFCRKVDNLSKCNLVGQLP